MNIILNCRNTEIRNHFALKLSKAYNIPIVNFKSVSSLLSLQKDHLSEEEFDMLKGIFSIKEKIDLEIDFQKKNEMMFDVLKEILRENVCKNRGYVLTGIPINEEEIRLLYTTTRFEELKEGDEGYEPPDPDEEMEDMEEEKNDLAKSVIINNNNENNINPDTNNNNNNNEEAGGNVDSNIDTNNNNMANMEMGNMEGGDGEPKKKKKPKKPKKI